MADSLPDGGTTGEVSVDFAQGLTIYGPLGVFAIAAMFVIAKLFSALATAWTARLTDSQANTKDTLVGLNNNTTALTAISVAIERQGKLNDELMTKLEGIEQQLKLMEARK